MPSRAAADALHAGFRAIAAAESVLSLRDSQPAMPPSFADADGTYADDRDGCRQRQPPPRR